MDEETFADKVIDELGCDEDIFRLMLRDIYQNGQVLYRKKYRLLGWFYRTFIARLAMSLASFLFEQTDGLSAFRGAAPSSPPALLWPVFTRSAPTTPRDHGIAYTQAPRQ